MTLVRRLGIKQTHIGFVSSLLIESESKLNSPLIYWLESATCHGYRNIHLDLAELGTKCGRAEPAAGEKYHLYSQPRRLLILDDGDGLIRPQDCSSVENI
ncbi:hypothetical protein [Denitrificimonas caeni]|uniref:hypothetical protein n=1 Tax=Denitrificimonas caeni TaxID=521720 RepID=UPI00196408B6|nr:hypothetical protein [Denitrificimonas caeni]